MRFKLFVGMLTFAAFTLTILIFMRPGTGVSPLASEPGTPTASKPLESLTETKPNVAEKPQSQAVSTESLPGNSSSGEQEQKAQGEEPGADSVDTKHNDYVEARVVELEELSRKSDRSSMETLLSEVSNPDKQIRHAALDALSQSGNRDAIPSLVELASRADQPEDRSAIDEVIEFLKMPTLTELMTQAKASGKSGNPVNEVKPTQAPVGSATTPGPAPLQ